MTEHGDYPWYTDEPIQTDEQVIAAGARNPHNGKAEQGIGIQLVQDPTSALTFEVHNRRGFWISRTSDKKTAENHVRHEGGYAVNTQTTDVYALDPDQGAWRWMRAGYFHRFVAHLRAPQS